MESSLGSCSFLKTGEKSPTDWILSGRVLATLAAILAPSLSPAIAQEETL